jgi:hypothetical protein
MSNPRVEETADGHLVIEGTTPIAGPFASNADAWRWIDRHADAGVGDDEHRANVRALIDRNGAVW